MVCVFYRLNKLFFLLNSKYTLLYQKCGKQDVIFSCFLPTFYAMQTVRIKIIKGLKCKSKAKKQP